MDTIFQASVFELKLPVRSFIDLMKTVLLAKLKQANPSVKAIESLRVLESMPLTGYGRMESPTYQFDGVQLKVDAASLLGFRDMTTAGFTASVAIDVPAKAVEEILLQEAKKATAHLGPKVSLEVSFIAGCPGDDRMGGSSTKSLLEVVVRAKPEVK